MVESLTSTLRRGDGNDKIIFDLFLTDELIEAAWPQAGIKGSVFRAWFA